MLDYRIVFAINILCIVSVVFFERKKPAEVISWVLVVTFLPGVGFILYMLIGETASLKIASRYRRKRLFDYSRRRALQDVASDGLAEAGAFGMAGGVAEAGALGMAGGAYAAGALGMAGGVAGSGGAFGMAGGASGSGGVGKMGGASGSGGVGKVGGASGSGGVGKVGGMDKTSAFAGLMVALGQGSVHTLDLSVARHLDMIRMFENPGDGALTSDNDIEVFTSASDKFDALYGDIEAAKKSVHMLYFAFNSDHVGTRFIELLTRKAREGVEVRIIYDMVGNINTRFWRFGQIKRAGGQVRHFFSLLSIFKINYRNHRKIAVIDGQIAYTGGINISKSYIGEHKRIKPWRDTHMRVVGSAVNALQERFLLDWMHVSDEQLDFGDARVVDEYFPSPQRTGRMSMQIVSSGPDVGGERIKCGYIKMINDAKIRVFMQSPYFIPDDAFMLALKLAVDSGVDVRIILPSVPDKPRVFIVTKSYARELLKLGVKVYFYRGFIHSKMLVADGDVVSIGTTNIDIRSFMLDFEINAFVYDAAFAARCEQIFYDDLENSDAVSLEEIERRSPLTKMAEAILRIVSPLL